MAAVAPGVAQVSGVLAAAGLRPLPLCAHCGLLVAGAAREPKGPLYCCGGCALAHRLTGGAAGHGQAVGMLMAVGVGAFLAMNVMMLSFVLYSGRGEADRAAGESWVRWALLGLATPALVLLGSPFLTRGFARVREWRLDTDALIVIGVTAAYVLSARSIFRGEGPLYLDTAMGILLFVTVGRYLEAAARARTTDALAGLVQQMPETATRIRNGLTEVVPVTDLASGDVVLVKPGERIPVDGCVREGEGGVSEAEITGEPLPRHRGPGEHVAAGTLSLDGSFLLDVERTGTATTLARLVRLVEEARAGRPPLAPLVDRLASAFVPMVLVLALSTFTYWTLRVGMGEGLLNALAVLLIACPCAIGIATPLAATAAAGRAAAAGVLVRSGGVFERLARSRRAFFDKTGTLTQGRPQLVSVLPAPGVSEHDLLAEAAALESRSEHPLGQAVCGTAAARGLSLPAVTSFRAYPGRGVMGTLTAPDGRSRRLLLGNAALTGITPPEGEPGTTLVHLSSEGTWRGSLAFRDLPRATAREALEFLSASGLALELLSGDRPDAVAAFAVGLPALVARGAQLPEDKLARVALSIARGETPIMVGDGINDAPALSGAAVGVTLESGTDLAREVAEVTILGGDLRRLPWVIGLARRTLTTAKVNLFWAFFYNLVGVVLAVSGRLHPLFGALAMVASSLMVVLFSQRLSRHPLPGSAA